MTSRELTSGFDFWSCVISAWSWCIFSSNLEQIPLSNPELLTFFPYSRWRRPPSWIFQVMLIWLFRCVDNVVYVVGTKFGLNTCYSHWDRRTYASDVHLITSRELTSGFDIWSRRYLHMTMMHLHIKFGAYLFIQSAVIDIFTKFKMAAAAILDFQVMWIWPFRRVDSMVFVLCTEFGSNICCSHWDRRTCASDFHLMTSRQLTSGFDIWSRGHLRMASVHIPIKYGADIFI